MLLLFFFPALLVLSSSLHGQSFNDKIYEAYITGNIGAWEELIRAGTIVNAGPDEMYNLAMAHYGFIGYCIGRDEKQRARPHLERAEQYADKLLEIRPDDPRYIALRGALYGLRLGYQPQKAMLIGPKAMKTVNLAIEKGSGCPVAWIEAGNMDWWMPALFGGSRERAVAEYEKAIAMMEQDPASIRNSWFYLNIHMILAAWLEERNMTFKAREIYRKLLDLEPRFEWAAEKLEDSR